MNLFSLSRSEETLYLKRRLLDGWSRLKENYKIAFNTLKKTMTSISPNLSHLNSTFPASPVFHQLLAKHYNAQETVHVLKSDDP